MTCQCVAFPTARSPSISPIFGRRFSVYAASLAVSQHRGTPCSIPSFCPRAENSSIAAKAWASISLTCCRSFSSAHPFFVFSSAATTLSKKVSSSDGFIKCSILLFLYPPRKRSGGCESFFYICVLEYGDSLHIYTDILLFCASFFCLFQSLQESPVFGSTLRSLDYGY